MPLKDPGQIEFDAPIEGGAGGGMWVRFPHNVRELYGIGGGVRVKATFDGVPYRGSLASMGMGCHVLGVLKAIREQIKKGPGDTVHVVIELDAEPRTVNVPADLQAALEANPAAKEKFEKLSYTNKKGQVRWIGEAKKAETRQARIEKVLGDGDE